MAKITAIKDVSVRVGGKSVLLSDLACDGEMLSFDGVRLVVRRPDGSLDVSTVFDENKEESRSMTQQSFKDECDINSIMSRYLKSGLLPIVENEPIYGDFSSGEDFSEAKRKVARFESLFELLPSDVRNRFNNDPSKCIEFALDVANENECVELGILPRKQVVEPVAPAGAVPADAPVAPAPVVAPVAPAE